MRTAADGATRLPHGPFPIPSLLRCAALVALSAVLPASGGRLRAGEAVAAPPAAEADAAAAAGEDWSWEGVEIPVRKGPHPLVERAATIRREVEYVLGARFARGEPVHTEVIDREEIAPLFLEELHNDYAPEEIAFAEDSAVRFGLAPPGFTLEETLLEFLTVGVAGFYVPRRKTLYLIEGQPMQGVVTAHELTHAFQDQRIDLLARQRERKRNDDAALAFTCLLEGEAVRSMTIYQERFGSPIEQITGAVQSLFMLDAQFEALRKAPRFLREGMLYPYTGGHLFVLVAHMRGGFPAVRKLYEDLPESSEQILHPRKYYSRRDRPTEIDLGPLVEALGPGWTRRGENTLGEFMVGCLLRTGDPDAEGPGLVDTLLPGVTGPTARAAAGWDGDRYTLVRLDADAPRPAGDDGNKDGTDSADATANAEDPSNAGTEKAEDDEPAREGLIWASAWDAPHEAAAFARAAAELFPRKGDDRSYERAAEPPGGTAYRWTQGEDPVRVCRLHVRGREALYLDGFTDAEAGRLLAAWRAAAADGSLFAADRRDPAPRRSPVPDGEEW